MRIPAVSRLRYNAIPGKTWVWDLETTGLNPAEHEATSIAWKKGILETVITRKKGQTEKEFLEQAVKKFPWDKGNHAGWNIQFDQVFLRTRLAANGIRPPKQLSLPMQDLMKWYHELVVTPEIGHGQKYRRLHEAMSELRLKNHDPHDGASMPEYWRQGRTISIRNHNLWDVRNEHAIMNLLHKRYQAFLHANSPTTSRQEKKALSPMIIRPLDKKKEW